MAYPKAIFVSETMCEVPLQHLLNHTSRLIEFLKPPSSENDNETLCLQIKYGFDGTSANSYKQRWNNEIGDDSHIFCLSRVPLQLMNNETKMIFWKNPAPSSTRFCRPIRMQFAKETKELTKAEERNLKDQINNLKPIKIAGYKVIVELHLTMIDGKVSNFGSKEVKKCMSIFLKKNNFFKSISSDIFKYNK